MGMGYNYSFLPLPIQDGISIFGCSADTCQYSMYSFTSTNSQYVENTIIVKYTYTCTVQSRYRNREE
jgi:hypothetical protein